MTHLEIFPHAFVNLEGGAGNLACDEVSGPIVIDERMDKGVVQPVKRDLEERTQTVRMLLVGDQSNFRPGGPIGKASIFGRRSGT